ncbi:MAG: hypothetical protein PHC34_10265, partial [Candidatus Gastranaerophilales bacterium]|nr:hypothetical protein [Candidatus Gastranaerophilales bacterium]
ELTRSKTQAVFRASDMMDQRSEDNCANMEQATGIITMAAILPIACTLACYPFTKKGKTMSNKQLMHFNVIASVLPLIPTIGIILWGNEKQKEASRIGRFQAKKNELKDPKNFVIYTPEQIEAAKILAKNIPDKKDIKNISKVFAEMKQMSKDKVEYEKWLKDRISNKDEIQKILNTKFTSEQIAQGEEDKEIIVNIVKDVNMSAETYCENVDNAFDSIGMISFVTNIPIFLGVNKILKKFKNVSQVTKIITPIFACTLFSLSMMFWCTHEKKQASRVGRFIKRQEILDNPELIMAYSDEQIKQAKDIKAPKIKKGFFEEIKDNFTFFGKYFKDKKEYEKYKKTTAKENENLYEALKQTDISEKQQKEAKNLQEKTFRSFDKIDEMSQRYSEDIEAATQVTMQLVNPIFTLISMGIPSVITVLLLKGKFPLKGLAKTVSKIVLNKESSLRIFIDKASQIINKDKELKKDFSKIIVDKKVQEKFINHPELNKIYMELISLNEKYLAQIEKIKDKNNPKEIIKNIAKDISDEHLKQDPVSKWVKNLLIDIIKLRTNIKFKNKLIEKPIKKSAKNKDPLKIITDFYKEYKTLCKSFLLGGFLPVIGIGFGIPFAISSWMTNIQIKAGRIGIMKAMEEIDNPKLFVKDNTETQKQNYDRKNLFNTFTVGLSSQLK